MISVVIIGGGNVATHLFKALNPNPFVEVKQWFSRTLEVIKPFSKQTIITNDLKALIWADIYILAVSDDSIKTVSEQLPFKDRLVAHTSGSASVHEIDQKQERGVFYPLQTFSKTTEVDFSTIPICIEALDKKSYALLKSLAEAIGSPWYKLSTEQRQILHVGAVFVNNFVNQLYRIAHEIVDVNQIDFDILKPLILETAQKVQHVSPYMAQTGPAKRNDIKTIKRHLKHIEKEEHKIIYELLTNSIKNTHGQR